MGTFSGTAGNDTLTGTEDTDLFDMRSGGDDHVTGKGGDDNFLFGDTLTALDSVEGGSGKDTVSLDGDYSGGVTFGANTIQHVEKLTLAAGHNYKLTTDDANVGAGKHLSVDASDLSGTDSLTFDGNAELNGSFKIRGGAGNDDVTGGRQKDFMAGGAGVDTLVGGYGTDGLHGNSGADTINGGHGIDSLMGGRGDDVLVGGRAADALDGRIGHDAFKYGGVIDSTGVERDTINGFNTHNDRLDLDVTVSGFDTAIHQGALSEATFATDFERALTADKLAAHHAVLWTAKTGDLSGHKFLIVDANGTAGYQDGQDYVIELTGVKNLADIDTSIFS